MGRPRVCSADVGSWRFRRWYGAVGGCSRRGSRPSWWSAAAVARCGGVCVGKLVVCELWGWGWGGLACAQQTSAPGDFGGGTEPSEGVRGGARVHRGGRRRQWLGAAVCVWESWLCVSCGVGVGAVSRVPSRRRLLAKSVAIWGRRLVFEVGLAAVEVVGGCGGSGAAVCVGRRVVCELCRQKPSLSPWAAARVAVFCFAARSTIGRASLSCRVSASPLLPLSAAASPGLFVRIPVVLLVELEHVVVEPLLRHRTARLPVALIAARGRAPQRSHCAAPARAPRASIAANSLHTNCMRVNG